jgi:hypothetical protein
MTSRRCENEDGNESTVFLEQSVTIDCVDGRSCSISDWGAAGSLPVAEVSRF